MTEWISVAERLPEGGDVVLVLHKDRPDYPITAHAYLGDDLHDMGNRINTNGASSYKWISWNSVGRDLTNPFNMASGYMGAFKDSVGYPRFLPSYFGAGITHWMPLPLTNLVTARSVDNINVKSYSR